MTHPFQYVTLRCVPRVDRGEFVNVGVLLHCPSADDLLTVAWHLDEQRLAALAPDLDLAALRRALTTVDRVCRGETGPGLPDLPTPGRRFGWLIAPRSTVLQPGPVHGGVCADPASAVEELMNRLVRMEERP